MEPFSIKIKESEGTTQGHFMKAASPLLVPFQSTFSRCFPTEGVAPGYYVMVFQAITWTLLLRGP